MRDQSNFCQSRTIPQFVTGYVSLITLASALASAAPAPEVEGIIVTATRVPTLIADEPLRVEAVPAEEIEENLTAAPGSLTSLLTELAGVRMQAVAPGLGGEQLQLRGMPERHTLVLSDGLPLLGAEPDAFGLLQTPPLDLARVEVIKGAASALYGGSALAGVLNLVSQTPDAESSVLANLTSRGGKDLVGFFTIPTDSRWSGTLTAGAHDQSREDVDGDGWADLPSFRRYTVRPRIWWKDGEDRSVLLTAGFMDETRDGGMTSFPEAVDTRRVDGGMLAHWKNIDGKLSMTSTRFDHSYGAQTVPYTQSTAFGEMSWSGGERQAWLVGVAFEHEQLSAAAVPGVSYAYNVPAVFAQDEFSPAPWMKLAASARLDFHNLYGTFFSPRVSALFREPYGAWSLRVSMGGGFAAPTPFVDEVQATSLATLLPPQDLHAERAASASLDAKWSGGPWDLNLSVFGSRLRDALDAQPVGPDRFELVNLPGTRDVTGAEALVNYVSGPVHLLASWTSLDSPESLVPRGTGEIGAILESEERGRIGIELGYTGEQKLADNPYRSVSRAYFEVNALAEIRFGEIAIYFNALNLTDVRQTHDDPLLRPTPGPGGNPITEVWAPLAGRTFNLGVRAEL